ncbi:hypothetical protein [Parahaliea aestuarii]|uniref:Uncharacterized protein n=1 Tax=Parahaliea aestuarii TaxID=1852021 RepID=A0A5C8ZXW7_9GAMM|nr:hypothetical protein [Parahaliea aestuarii]TXS93433.1 hypothetical protein FVW59_06260 [Parahaliea aestuarii]
MEQLYNVYFAGEALPGQDENAVRQRLQGLFKADEATLQRLFSGKPQLIKRECDKATALKYKQAMEKAGAKPVIRRHAAEPAPAQRTSAPAQEQRPRTMAERVAALASAAPSQAGRTAPPSAAAPAASDDDSGDKGLALSPPRSEVLRPQERRQFVPRDVDTSALSLTGSGTRLSDPEPEPPPAPDTGHLSVAASGETIPNLPRYAAPLNPDTSAIDLAPAGSDFSDCAPPPAPAPALDLAGLDLAPSGSDLLDGKYRSSAAAAAPDTSHLALEKP